METTKKIYSRVTTAQHVANFILEKSWDRQKSDARFNVGVLKLNKLVFLTFGFVSHFCKRYLFSEEIEAWRYGPVIPSLYHEFKRFDRNPITKSEDNYAHFLIENEGEFGGKNSFSFKSVIPLISKEEDKKLLNRMDEVFDTFGNLDAFALVNITHRSNTPWSVTYDGTRGKTIDRELIRLFYQHLCRENNWT